MPVGSIESEGNRLQRLLWIEDWWAVWIGLGLLLIIVLRLMRLVVVIVTVASIANAADDTPNSASRHQEMLQLLGEAAQQAADHGPYVGSGRLNKLHQRLRELPENTAPMIRWQLLRLVAFEELRLGAIDDAVTNYEKAFALVEKVKNDPTQRAAYELNLYELSVAYLRSAISDECVSRSRAENCRIQVAKAAVPRDIDAARKAIEKLESLLALASGNVPAQWLLNVAYMVVGEYPQSVPEEYRIPVDRFSSKRQFPHFRDLSRELGVDVVDLAGSVVIDDFDNDSNFDLVVSTGDPNGQLRYFKARPGSGFVERTKDSGLQGLLGGISLLQADYDNDGDLDLLVLRGGGLGMAGQIPNSLLQNDGSGRFHDVTFKVGLGSQHFPTQAAAWADFDNDGDLDVYIGNESSSRFKAPAQLFRNEADGRFVDIAAQSGVGNFRYTKGVSWGDYNGDRYPDLYISNMGEENRLYRNNGDGTFTDVASSLDMTKPQFGFLAWFWDYDNDGFLDIYASSYAGSVAEVAQEYLGQDPGVETASLYRGRVDGRFEDVSEAVGLDRVAPATAGNLGDLDNDGFLDLYLSTGRPGFDALIPNLMFLNDRGKAFVDVSSPGGFGRLEKGAGVAFADFDADGDQDIYLQAGGPYPGDAAANALFQNPGFGNHWVQVHLRGVGSNRFGVGARIRCDVTEDGKSRSIYHHVTSGGGAGANPLAPFIGLGKATKIDRLEVYWPTTDMTTSFENILADQRLVISENAKIEVGAKRSGLAQRSPSASR